MSIAWAPLVLLLLLLPGLGAWIGYHLVMQKPVEDAPRVPSFQLGDTSVSAAAAVAGMALVAHAILATAGRFAWRDRQTDYNLLLMALEVGKDDASPGALATSIQTHWPRMLGYFALSFAIGIALGILGGILLRKAGHRLLRTSWARNLLPQKDEAVEATVELLVADGCRCRVFYVGRLVEYRATRLGVISEVVLANAQRHEEGTTRPTSGEKPSPGEPPPAGEKAPSVEEQPPAAPAEEPPPPSAARPVRVPYTIIPGTQILAVQMARVEVPKPGAEPPPAPEPGRSSAPPDIPIVGPIVAGTAAGDAAPAAPADSAPDAAPAAPAEQNDAEAGQNEAYG